jgi:polyribonucleotide nucleotidyltransferase
MPSNSFQSVPLRHSITFQDQKLTLETGLLALQATSSVVATIGETTVMANVVVGKVDMNIDYFPLQIIYEEKMYASGKIRGSRFEKREGKPSDTAVLAGRAVDRSLRSLFNDNYRNSLQVVITILSVDEVNSPDILAILAGSAALSLATPDFGGPVSGVRVGLLSEKLKANSENIPLSGGDTAGIGGTKEQNILINPSYLQMESSDLDLIVSGDGDNIMMVEAGANIVDEEIIGKCLDVACGELKVLTDFQNEFITLAKIKGLAKQVELTSQEIDSKYSEYWSNYTRQIENIMYGEGNKEEKSKALVVYEKHHKKALDLAKRFKQSLNQDIREELESHDSGIAQTILNLIEGEADLYNADSNLFKAFHSHVGTIVKDNILERERRVDGRRLDETRTITAQIDVLPRVHGSSLFSRGETQVLNVLTLGTLRDAQTLDGMEEFVEADKPYIHHYNFPSYSVGETGRYGPVGRREIGHGALAERALLPVLPKESDFPYTMRLVSECLGSNGSTSMASTCASSLSLMAGGVPIKDMVGGVAMGLVMSQSGSYKVLTDIQGLEDHHGDMDFKVTGTRDGITAIQLDNKVAGLTPQILKEALIESKKGRLHILDIMKECISKPKNQISQYAKKVISMTVPMHKIRDVIGSGGKVINGMQDKYGVKIDLENETGQTYIYGKENQAVEDCRSEILSMIKEYQIGDQVSAKVLRILPFGAFVSMDGGSMEAMIHISKMSKERIEKVEDALKIGQEVPCKVLEIKDNGNISLGVILDK